MWDKKKNYKSFKEIIIKSHVKGGVGVVETLYASCHKSLLNEEEDKTLDNKGLIWSTMGSFRFMGENAILKQ